MPNTKTRAVGGNPGGVRGGGLLQGGFAARPVSRFFAAMFFLSSFFPISFASCATVSPIDGRPLAAATVPEDVLPLWRPLPDAGTCLAYFSGTVSSPRLEFHALRFYLFSPGLRIVASGGMVGDPGLATRVSSFVRDGDLVAGINALPFEPVSDREGEPRTNIGLVVADGVTISPAHPRFDALVFFGDGSAAIKAQSEIGGVDGISNAVGGFRRILENYEPVPRVLDLQARHPRSAAGLSSCGRFLYLLVIDGRRAGSVGGTEAETALLLRSLGAAEGINFDGGGSSSLAVRFPDGGVRVLNTPVHGHFPQGRERAVAGVLGIGKRPPAETPP